MGDLPQAQADASTFTVASGRGTALQLPSRTVTAGQTRCEPEPPKHGIGSLGVHQPRCAESSDLRFRHGHGECAVVSHLG
jgi:hypothetical protein